MSTALNIDCKEMLNAIKKFERRSLRAVLELLIEERFQEIEEEKKLAEQVKK